MPYVAPKRNVKRQTSDSISLEAPIGGVNTINSGGKMPAEDCIYAYNVVAAEFGLRVRLGYKEFATGLLSATGNPADPVEIRSIIPFYGSAQSGANNRLFVTTTGGIYDITEGGIAATANWAALTTYSPGDRVLHDSGKTYKYVIQPWLANTAYLLNDRVAANGNYYICTVPGTSDVAPATGPSGTGTGIVDGTVTWDYEAAPTGTTAAAPGPSGTTTGIVDGTVTWDYQLAPTKVITFGTTSGDAGRGISAVYVNTTVGHHLAYCDEENGYYLYNEADDLWRKIIHISATPGGSSVGDWANNHAYTAGDIVQNDSGKAYICKTTGTSAVAPATGPSGTGTAIVDGTCTWDYYPYFVTGVDPAKFVHVAVWKHRLVFTQKDSTKAWYLGTNALYGAGTAFNFGSQFRAGGTLVGVWSWTYDGGAGADDKLVALSSGGDVAVYEGLDFNGTDFGVKGTWYISAPPKGRRVATDFGGDILILSTVGLVPLSKLVVGITPLDRQQYSTYKISNLFNVLMVQYSGINGWAVHVHPQDNTLVIAVPQEEGQPTIQLAMSFGNRAWTQYRDLPIFSAGTWNGQFYFGTIDGRVCLNEDYVDNVKLADTTSYDTIQWSVLGAFQNLGNGRQKQVKSVRATVLAEGMAPAFDVKVKYHYDFTEILNPVALNPATGSTWDAATWDASVWAGTYAASQRIFGAEGMGPEFAIAIRGNATTRTVIVGYDVLLEMGGFL